jgi:salicylate hydroxylase
MALFDRKPMSRWSVGRVTLLGDACHAMLPFMAQGAAQAIEDGAALAACLSNIDTRHVPQALNRYERLRPPRATRVQGLSEGNKQRFHLPDGPAQLERDAEMAAARLIGPSTRLTGSTGTMRARSGIVTLIA